MQDILQDFGNTHRIAGPELQQDLPCISNLDNLCLFVMACAKLMITKLVRNAMYAFTRQPNREFTFCRHCATKSWKVRDHLSRSARRGGGSLEIMKMTLMGCTDHLGGVTSAISTALMPSAHTSTCQSNTLCLQVLETIR